MAHRRSPAPADPPRAFTEKVKGAMRLAAIDETARRLGLVPGLSLADARAQLPDLEVEEHDPEADRRWLDRLCDGCARYTPMAAASPPDALVLDIAGCAHLFGGEAALAEDAVARLRAIGMRVRAARAATAEGALALARHGKGAVEDETDAIRRLPVAALELDAESDLGLRRAGLKTVGAVADRPRPAIAARFGKQAVTALARLLGEERGPLAPRLPLGTVHAERRFPEPVARTEYALEILGELAREAEEALRQRGKGGRRFSALFFRSDGLAQKLAIEFGRPVRDPAAVMRLFGEKLDSLGDPLDPGFGFDAIRLSVGGEEELAP
ncbi:MAG: DNA polymerase Y family protein, partial [Sphingomonadales bacterium]|nr:DNA polymerase Y family protein [Sphingomonadales bacterium]